LKALETSIWAALAMLLAFYGTFLGGFVCLVIIFDRVGRVDKGVTSITLLLTIILLVWFGSGLIAEAFGLKYIHNNIALVMLMIASL
jgi:hypothetical protein